MKKYNQALLGPFKCPMLADSLLADLDLAALGDGSTETEVQNLS